MIKLDLVGQRFGRLVVQSKFGSVKQKVVWICICDCGKETRVPSAMLRSGNTKSCGCLGIEARNASASASNRTHGMSRTPTYESWFNMKRRCFEPSHKSYKDYGGRGITVCEAWLKFEPFLASMGECPAGMSIERTDVNGNYEPGNCCWATSKEQGNNRRNNRLLTAFGMTKTLTEWADSTGVSVHALSKRLSAGWPVAKAVSLPMKADKRRLEHA